MSRAPAPLFAMEVSRDGKQIGLDRFQPWFLGRRPGPDERLCGDVLGVMGIFGQPVGEAIHVAGIPAVQLVERDWTLAHADTIPQQRESYRAGRREAIPAFFISRAGNAQLVEGGRTIAHADTIPPERKSYTHSARGRRSRLIFSTFSAEKHTREQPLSRFQFVSVSFETARGC
jgi:hypothetical protein